ncbi:hypothetical protein AC578_4195 [Pseudocercospora eumusae]|uniref:Zn(2)-C6 fungal-type domain-containing protein n=1 Tax=Pseudocercospora eumusae TaxID=321146 RepID=A0A139HJ30_9PEZI|nr:hypothetical protein AC578_4195 [Pseudocercospora eumusae]
MYGSPTQSGGQWNPNQNPPTSQPNQQPPQQWSPQAPNGQYQQPRQPNQLPVITQASSQQPPMATLQPNHPDQYRATLPPPQAMYPPPYQQAPQMAYPPAQPAPRQRTAIACRYCRRRKIRCSGFDQSEDGRCTNCVRFSQECVFTPVSAQTQAFVPAHTVYRGQNPPPNTQLYGAYGQPLHNNRDPYVPQQGGQQQQPGQYPPPPQGYQQQQMYQQPQQGQAQSAGTKRPNDEPHTPTLPPPNPGAQSQGQYPYPNASGTLLTPSSYFTPPPSHPFYVQPQSPYAYEASRASSSSHSSHDRAPVQETRVPLASTRNGQRPGANTDELAGQAKKDERSSTDSSMLSATTRGPK